MRILGLHAVGHDAAACLIEDGHVTSIGEERLTRRKNQGGFPHRAIAHLLAGRPLTEVDLVVLDVCDGGTPDAVRALRAAGYGGELRLVDHHLAHAASAHFVAPDDGAAVLVVDAGGTRQDEWPTDLPLPPTFRGAPFDQEVQSFFVARGRTLDVLHQTFTRPGARIGLGWLYALVTVHLGFGPLDAGKTMGLAAHAPPASDVIDWVTPGGDLLFDVELDVARPESWTPHHDRLFGGLPARREHEPLDERHAALAARLQRTTEAGLLHLARQLHDATRASTLCFSGGVALNVLANTRLSSETPFARVEVQAAASDTGIALGCALLGAIERGVPLPAAPEISSLAPAPSDADYDAAITFCRDRGHVVSRPHDLLARVVAALASERLVGWVEGGSELGPRALGHRTLLADARDPGAKDRVNALVKHREAFRPFAPIVLAENARDWFEIERTSPNMLFSAAVRPEARSRLPAITHVDGTARVQTVSTRYPGRIRSLLERFYAETGVPVLLNTSLNGPTEPICESPHDAARLFHESGMHALVLGDYLVEKTPSK